jgi:glycosyltransferase involved in cell wall biosynthesis
MKLSVVIITCNEENNIRRCLGSVQSVADEIIVLDSGSTDRTEAICNEFGVRFFYQSWKGYGKQKNDANDLASGDYILSLDADEALSETLQQSILVVKTKNEPDAVAYRMNRLTNYCGRQIRHCGWYPDAKIRLWKKDCAKWDNAMVHEQLQLTKETFIQHLQGDMFHFPFYSIKEHLDVINKYSELAAQKAFEKGKKRSLVSILFSTIWRFKHDYFLKCGFLDGFYGFVICSLNAFSTFLRYVKLKQLYHQKKTQP